LKEHIMSAETKPRIGIILGDPAGIGPELTARLLSDPAVFERARIVLIGDERHWQAGLSVAAVSAPNPVRIGSPDDIEKNEDDFLLLDFPTIDPQTIACGEVDARAGKAVLDTLLYTLEVIREGHLDGFLFAPLNKESLHKGGSPYSSELELFKEHLPGHSALEEINILDESWTMRVTSHVGIRDVAAMISTENVLAAIRFVDRAMRDYGKEAPRLAVAALNPHNGEHGLFGDEEGRFIEPAVKKAREEGVVAEGPFPSDTVFIKLRDGLYDAVIAMYHDQCQIATKLMGFHRGVTYHAGFPVPITTPAHGTAFDRAGTGTADPGATRNAFDVVCRIAANRASRR
jgi:4-hydroxythreonine-4-phosphate dehydrogenase